MSSLTTLGLLLERTARRNEPADFTSDVYSEKLMLFSLTREPREHYEHAGYDTRKTLTYCGLSYDGLPASSHSVSAQPSHLPLEVTLEFQVGLVSLC